MYLQCCFPSLDLLQPPLTWVLLLCKSYNVDALNIVLLRRKTNSKCLVIFRVGTNYIKRCQQPDDHRSPRSQTCLLRGAFSELVWQEQKNTPTDAMIVCLYNGPQQKVTFFGVFSWTKLFVYRLCSVMNSTSSSSEWGLPGMVTGSSMKGS